MAVTLVYEARGIRYWRGLSNESKPSPQARWAAYFHEDDTGADFVWRGDIWVETTRPTGTSVAGHGHDQRYYTETEHGGVIPAGHHAPESGESTTHTHAGGSHPDLATHDTLGLATQAELDSHAAASDPHTGYQRESEKGAVNGYASLDAGGTVPDAQIPVAIARDSELHAVESGQSVTHTHATHDTAHANDHPASHTLASHSAKAHSDLTGIGAGDHHAAFVQADHDALANPHHANANDPTTDQKAALAGTSGVVGVNNKYVTDADARNTNSRAPNGTASGELAGSYPSPTVAATHSGSAHHAQAHGNADHTAAPTPSTQAFGDAAVTGTDAGPARGDHKHAMMVNPMTAHEAASDPHTGYVREADPNWTDLTDAGETTLHSHAGGSGDMTKAVYDPNDDGVIAAAQLDPAMATDAEVTSAVSDHAAAADPHAGYRLESADHSHASTGLQAGQLAAANTHGSPAADTHHPQLHAAAHKAAGGDAIKLDELAAPTDVTTLNASASAHGLMQKYPGGTSNFLRADGTFAAPPGGGGAWTTLVKTADQTNNTTTLQDDTVLQFNTVANTQYTIRLLAFGLTNATADFKYRLVHTGTTTRVRRRVKRTATTDIAQTIELKTAFDAADVVLSTTGLNPWVEEDIIVQVGASGGVLKLQFAQVTANAGPTSLLEGSYLEYATA